MNASEQATDFLVRKGVKVAAIGESYFGDSGKGKFVDVFGQWPDATVRSTGGANAGHTINHDGEKYVFHLLPSSIARDAEGKLSIVGRGTVLNPGGFAKELQDLDGKGRSSEGLRVSQDAQMVLPWHPVLDHLHEALAGDGKIGTTKQGIGPAYTAHRSRVGVRVNDLLNPDLLRKSVERSLADAASYFIASPDLAREAIQRIEGGAFYHRSRFFKCDAVVEWLLKKAERFRDHITDTDELVRSMLRNDKRVLLEGAQAVLLSIECGTYPFVTSSDCSLAGLAQGAGLRTEDVGYMATILKAYATRVGEGPFPTEITDATVASSLQELGEERGSTTKRIRRVGWLDLPLLRYAARYSSRSFALTKADVLAKHGTVKVCTSYIYNGPDRWEGTKLYTKDRVITIAVPYPEILDHCTPVLREFPMWHDVSAKVTHSKAGLEPALLEFVRFIETELDGSVDILSTGPDREDTIFF